MVVVRLGSVVRVYLHVTVLPEINTSDTVIIIRSFIYITPVKTV